MAISIGPSVDAVLEPVDDHAQKGQGRSRMPQTTR